MSFLSQPQVSIHQTTVVVGGGGGFFFLFVCFLHNGTGLVFES